MSTIRLFFCLAFAGLVTTAPVAAQNYEHDWKVDEFLGWYFSYVSYADKTDQKIELHVKRGVITEFIENKSIWKEWRGRFEKLGLNQFIFNPTKITNEKEEDILARKDWCNVLRVEMSNFIKYEPDGLHLLTLRFFKSETDGRTDSNRCGGLSYHNFDPPPEKYTK